MIAISALIGNAETYVQVTRTLGWTLSEYQRWRYRTWKYLATGIGPGETAVSTTVDN